MKSNFEFLKEYWPALAQIGETAENYLYSDPNACIYKIGLFTERLVQEILVFEGIIEPEKDNTHANRIRLLKRAGLLPREIDNTLYFLRKTRNSAVHAGADSVDEAKVLISHVIICDIRSVPECARTQQISTRFRKSWDMQISKLRWIFMQRLQAKENTV